MCACMCMSVCLPVHVSVCICACASVRLYLHVCKCVLCVCACLCLCVPVSVPLSVSASLCASVHSLPHPKIPIWHKTGLNMAKLFLKFFTFQALNHHNWTILSPILKTLVAISRDRENAGAVLKRRTMRVD